ncbi:hypothetical protein B296_00035470 [Ensete ventricosum]|uniref:Uncharacterized protein n=1 Tax=Ensete ventricosum TaxID=4639 RepID=A0A426XN37_ENSVE|nr:hypothetical protein B296_00035470 [Ensete ventricosum]
MLLSWQGTGQLLPDREEQLQEVGVSLKWTSRDIDNISPFLSKEEVEQLGHLRGILSSSKTVQSMDEEWLVPQSGP